MISGKPTVIDLKDCIRFEDANVLVLAKPAGWLSQEADHSNEPSVVSLLQEYLDRPYVGLVHRLDRNTSGLMIIAKRTKAAQRLSEDLKDGKLDRTYLAFLSGKVRSKAVWRDRLLKDEAEKKSRPSTSEGREAELTITPIGYGIADHARFTLAQIELETGRFHQIRAQADIRGHALLGDTKYGSAATHSAHLVSRPALHSHTLKFIHPILKNVIEFIEPLPNDLAPLSKLIVERL